MRSRSILPTVLTGAALGVAACGGSGSGSSAHGSRGAGAAIPGPVKIYRVTLTGAAETSAGAPAGSGAAVIALHKSSELCWRFAHLHGFAGATSARIYKARAGKSGKPAVSLSHGDHLHHQGCVHVNPAVASAIEADPAAYYVNIHSTQYAAGAVRGQL